MPAKHASISSWFIGLSSPLKCTVSILIQHTDVCFTKHGINSKKIGSGRVQEGWMARKTGDKGLCLM